MLNIRGMSTAETPLYAWHCASVPLEWGAVRKASVTSLPIAGMSPGFSSRISMSSYLGCQIAGEPSRGHRGPERATHVVRCVRYSWVSRMTDVNGNYSAMSRIAVLLDQKPAVRPISTPESASPCFQEWPGGQNSHLCAQLVPHFLTFEHTTPSALRSMLNFEHVPSPKHGPIVIGQRER